MNSFVKISGIFTFLVLLVFAFIFYKERTITFDMSFQEFYIILTQKFVTNLRVGALIPQIIPIGLRWANCPLRAILIAHSAGFVIYYFMLFCLITFVLRQHAAALVFLLSSVLLVNDTFYWIQSELPQGLAWLILYYAYIEKKGVGDISRRPALHAVMLLFLQFFHPLMFVPILYVVLYSLYTHYKWDVSFYKWPVGFVLFNFCIRIWAGRFNEYENARLDITGIFQSHLIVPSVKQIIHFSTSDYLMYWLVFLLVTMVLITKRGLFELALLISFTTGYLLLICLANPTADKFYLENMMLPLGIFALLPFAQILMKENFSYKRVSFIMLLMVIGIRLVSIYNTHVLYTNRLVWYCQKFDEMDKNHSQRLLVVAKKAYYDTLIMTWPSGYESILLSSIDGPEHAKSVVVDRELAEYRPFINSDKLLLAKWGVWPDEQLPEKYFAMRPGSYVTE